MASRRSLVRASSGYGISVIVGGIISVAIIPVVIIVAGPSTWANIAVAQGVAGFGVVLVGAGWAVTGPTDIALVPVEKRGAYYVDSVVSRGWLYLIVTVVCSFIAIALTRNQPVIVVVTVAAGLLAGLSAGWFFVGESSPFRFLAFETIPRNVGAIIGAVLLFTTHDPLWYVGLQFLGALASTVLATVSILRRYSNWRVDLSFVRAVARTREHLPAVSMSATATLYVNLPIVVVQIFAPQATALYALAERIMRLALYATRPLVQIAQGYVPRLDRREQTQRARTVVTLTLWLGLVGGVAYAAAAPVIGQILSGDRLSISFGVSISLGVALAAMLVSQITGFAVLTAFKMTRVLAWSTISGAVVGVLLLIPGTIAFGITGLSAGLAASEVAVLIYQLIALRHVLWSPLPGSHG